MREIEIHLPKGTSEQEVANAVDAACREAGLTTVSKGSLVKFPGCKHWHFKLGEQPGTLELTYWPKEQRLWFSLRANRYAHWMVAAVPKLKIDIERWLFVNLREVHA